MKSPEHLLLEYCKQILGSVERTHFDYKTKNDRINATLHDDDKRNLAKSVSGFANSSGGVLIWGIEDKKTTAKQIADIERFAAELVNLAAQITDPVVPGIDVGWLPSGVTTDHSGFALLYVPESMLPPHRVILKDPDVKNHYYVRSGESFVVATHTQLEEMFGRRPKPQLSLKTRIIDVSHETGIAPARYQVQIILGIQNEGRGAARAPFLSVAIQPPYSISRYGLDGNGHEGLNRLTVSASAREHRYGASADIIIHSDVLHEVTTVIGKFTELLPGPTDLIIDYKIAAEGIQTISGRKIVPTQDILYVMQQNPNS
jgi:hypothetical protein